MALRVPGAPRTLAGGSHPGGETGDAGPDDAGGVDVGCETDAGSVNREWALWLMPNAPMDVVGGAPNPGARAMSSITADGTITDHITGLMWQKEASASFATQSAAASACSSLRLAGDCGWRLPPSSNYTRSSTMRHSARRGPDSTSTSTPGGGYWSSSAVAGRPGYGWLVDFIDGSSKQQHIRHLRVLQVCAMTAVRAIRWRILGTIVGVAALLVVAPRLDAKAPAGRYIVSNGTVYDAFTKLTWQQSSPSTTYTQAAATGHCASLSRRQRLATAHGEGARNDHRRERETTMIDTTAFQGSLQLPFWSVTQVSGGQSGYQVTFDVNSPPVAYAPVTNGNYTRCVRP